MRFDSPLDTVLDPAIQQLVGHFASPRLPAALKRLPSILRDPKGRLSDAGIYGFDGLLSPELIPLAEKLYWQVVVRGGAGSRYAREGLLAPLALAAAPRSLPFWERALEHSVPRDQFRKLQQEFAVAGIARIARQDDGATARELLLSLASSHPNPHIQVLAIRALWLHRPSPLPDDVVALLKQLAVESRPLSLRHMARCGLKTAQLPVPLDLPGGSVVAQLKFEHDKGSFTSSIEVATDSTLHTLHRTIQEALDWDADHLYVFSIGSAGTISGLSPFGEHTGGDDPDAGDWKIGELGLVKGASLSYLFDFGDKHRFKLRIIELRSQATGDLPQVLSREGRRPVQYPSYR
jgi:hypothetical protein